MWIVCVVAADSHEITRLLFSEKYKGKKIKMSSAAAVICIAKGSNNNNNNNDNN